MKQISVSEFRRNLKKYSEIVQKEDLEVTDRGKVLFIVKNPKSNKEDAFNTLIGVARSDIPYEEIFKEKIREL